MKNKPHHSDYYGRTRRIRTPCGIFALTLALAASAAAGANLERIDARDGTWDCVRDVAANLTWEVKTADGGLRDARHTYAWSPAHVAGSVARCAQTSCDAHSYIAAVNRAGLCGATDWRLPTREELRRLVDYTRARGAMVDAAFFPNTMAQFYWSSDIDASDARNAWGIGFAYGFDYAYPKENAVHVRLVRGPVHDSGTACAAHPAQRFETHDDGTVKDLSTGLVWQRCSVGLAWENGRCAGEIRRLTRDQLGSVATPPWRVPRVNELAGLADLSCTTPAIDARTFPDTRASDYWTVTPFAINPTLHWFVNFMYGDSYANDAEALGFARLVRD